MIPTFERIDLPALSSAHIVHVKGRRFEAPWHFHPEYELVWIVSSHGRRFVGDSADPFDVNDLVLMGPYLPHFWRNDRGSGPGGIAEAIVVQFGAELERMLASVPEGQAMLGLFAESARGIQFSAGMIPVLRDRLAALLNQKGLLLLLEIISIFQLLCQDRNRTLLTGANYHPTADGDETERMKRILDFMVKRYSRPVRLNEVAGLVEMHPSAFCRYFKQRMGRSFVDYLNAHRVEQAKRLLAQGRLSVKDVSLACGFRNLSNFHRRFKEHAGMTPLEFEKKQRESGRSTPEKLCPSR